MDNKNHEAMGMIFIMALIIFIAKVMFAIVAAIALFFTAFLSVVSVITILKDGVSLDGEYVSAHQGKMFFARGFIGAVALPIFLAVFFALLGEQIEIEPHWVWLTGFVLGSTGVEYLYAQQEAEQAKASEMVVLPPLPEERPHIPPVVPPAQPERPFRFASWEDEERGQ